jgi:hypothetical protein
MKSRLIRHIWASIISAASLLLAIAIPLRVVLFRDILPWETGAEWIVTLLFGADIAVRFVRPLYAVDSASNTRMTIAGYGRWKLAADLLAAFPVRLIFPGSAFELLRLLKLFRTAEYFQQIQRRSIRHWGMLRLVFFVIWFVIVIHGLTCGWLSLQGIAPGQDVYSSYVLALYWCISTLSSVGYGDVIPTTTGERIYAIGVMMVGVGMYSYIIGNVATILTGIQPARRRYLENMERLSAFMRYRRIPPGLQRKLLDYFSYAWDKMLGYDESRVISELPPSLTGEVSLFLKRDIIEKVPFLKGASEELVREIALQMRPVVYTPGDYVFRAGEPGAEMFFINRGTLEVLARDGVTVFTTLVDGDFFGEIALVLDTPRTASVRALDYCDLYALNKEAFDAILRRYPDFKAHVNKMTKERQERGM